MTQKSKQNKLLAFLFCVFFEFQSVPLSGSAKQILFYFNNEVSYELA